MRGKLALFIPRKDLLNPTPDQVRFVPEVSHVHPKDTLVVVHQTQRRETRHGQHEAKQRGERTALSWRERADAKGEQTSSGREQVIALAPGGATLRIEHEFHALAIRYLVNLLDEVCGPRVNGMV
jgi:hypothetical protein